MFKVIELTDSDDETQEATLPTKKPKLVLPEKKTAAQHLTEVLEAASNASGSPHSIKQKAKSLPTTPIKPTTTVDSSVLTLPAPSSSSSTVTNPLDISTCSSSSSSSPTTKPGRQRSRKTQHQTMRLSPDMQFETITLDDEDQIQPIILTLPPPMAQTTTTATSTVTSSMPQVFAIPGTQISSISSANLRQIRHKPPMDKASRENLVKKVAEVFISRPDTSTVIRQIAEERIRINYLLTVFNMQEMNFTVNSHIEMLRFQFRDRLKQRRQQIMNNELEQQVRDKQIRQLQMEQELLMQQDAAEKELNEQDELLSLGLL